MSRFFGKKTFRNGRGAPLPPPTLPLILARCVSTLSDTRIASHTCASHVIYSLLSRLLFEIRHYRELEALLETADCALLLKRLQLGNPSARSRAELETVALLKV